MILFHSHWHYVTLSLILRYIFIHYLLHCDWCYYIVFDTYYMKLSLILHYIVFNTTLLCCWYYVTLSLIQHYIVVNIIVDTTLHWRWYYVTLPLILRYIVIDTTLLLCCFPNWKVLILHVLLKYCFINISNKTILFKEIYASVRCPYVLCCFDDQFSVVPMEAFSDRLNRLQHCIAENIREASRLIRP